MSLRTKKKDSSSPAVVAYLPFILLRKSIRIKLIPHLRPIVNGIDSVTSRLGQYLDIFLQKSVTTTKAYLKDTKSLLQELKEINLTGMNEVFLVTSDVTSLYTIIQHEDALLALNWALSKREDLPLRDKKSFLRDALDFCLA